MPTLFCPKSEQEQDTSNEVGVSVMSKALNKILDFIYPQMVVNERTLVPEKKSLG